MSKLMEPLARLGGLLEPPAEAARGATRSFAAHANAAGREPLAASVAHRKLQVASQMTNERQSIFWRAFRRPARCA